MCCQKLWPCSFDMAEWLQDAWTGTLQVLLDMSRAASMTDMRPNRGAMMIQILQLFIREFFDQNPLSHLSIMILRNGRAERLTELSGSPVSASPCLNVHVKPILVCGQPRGKPWPGKPEPVLTSMSLCSQPASHNISTTPAFTLPWH